MSKQPVTIDGASLTIEQLHAAANGAEIALCPLAKVRMEESANWLAERSDALNILGKKRAWLIGLSGQRQESDSEPVSVDVDQKASVLSFIRGHCAGVGTPLPKVEVRAMMVARLNVMAKGLSGCRPLVVHRYIEMLNQGITPVVPSKGSVGAAGGAQLAHVLQVVLGQGGSAMVNEKVIPGADAVRHLGKIEISGKEALSLINGSSLTTALGALAVHRAQKLLTSAEAAAALTFEVVRADTDCLNLDALQARGHAGAADVAARTLSQLKGSNLVAPGRAPDQG